MESFIAYATHQHLISISPKEQDSFCFIRPIFLFSILHTKQANELFFYAIVFLAFEYSIHQLSLPFVVLFSHFNSFYFFSLNNSSNNFSSPNLSTGSKNPLDDTTKTLHSPMSFSLSCVFISAWIVSYALWYALLMLPFIVLLRDVAS